MFLKKWLWECLVCYVKSEVTGHREKQWQTIIDVNILQSCDHCRLLYGCKNKLPSLKQESQSVEELVCCKEPVSLHKAAQSSWVFGPQPYSSQDLKLPQAASNLPAETWFYFSWHKILHYFLSVPELCLSIFNPRQQNEPTLCTLDWCNIDCVQEWHLNFS